MIAGVVDSVEFFHNCFQIPALAVGICGRLPVYLDNDQGRREYWDLVSIALIYPLIFENNPIYRVNEQGFSAESGRNRLPGIFSRKYGSVSEIPRRFHGAVFLGRGSGLWTAGKKEYYAYE